MKQTIHLLGYLDLWDPPYMSIIEYIYIYTMGFNTKYRQFLMIWGTPILGNLHLVIVNCS